MNPVSHIELQTIREVLLGLQAEIVVILSQNPDAHLAEQMQFVLKLTKIFLGRSIRTGHVTGYSNLRCDQNLTVYFNLLYRKDTLPLPLSIEMRPRHDPPYL